MFSFCRPKPINLYFYTTREDVFNHARPKKAIDFFPGWVKKLPRPEIDVDPGHRLLHKVNMKTCSGLTNLYSSGFMVPMWSDLNVELGREKYRYQFADAISEIGRHDNSQMAGSGFNNTHFHLKLINPWFIYADQNVNILLTAPVWNDFGTGDIVVAPGILEPHVCPMDLNVNLFFKFKEQTELYSLLLGQPLLHAIPLTERKIKLNYELVTEKELKSIMARSPFNLMHLNRYHRTKKLCPHA